MENLTFLAVPKPKQDLIGDSFHVLEGESSIGPEDLFYVFGEIF
jgi:hypothetical protein